MNRLKSKSLWIIATIVLAIGYFLSCTKHDQVLDLPKSPVTVAAADLTAYKTSTAPTIDGVIDPVWANCSKLTTLLTVPDPGNDYFKGYAGATATIGLRTMYDQNRIYFLAEWNDPTKSLNRDPWYFDPVTKKWMQESRKPTYDAAGNKMRDAFYEDKFAMLWNVNNSVSDFNSKGCYASCHTSLDPTTHGGATARHFTGSNTQFLDMWHWKSVRTGLPSGQIDDQFQNNTEFDLADGGRHGDPKVSGGYADNVQTLTVTGGTPGQTASVPKYFVPGSTNYYWVNKADQVSGVAKLITAVDVNGVLSYSGGSIDPNTDAAFQRNGTTTGSKCIPSVCDIAPFVGDRGDIDGQAIFTGNGWILEFSRPLVTASGHGTNTDVQFHPDSEYVFGIAIFENAAIAHAINSRFTLTFQK
jgi:hypothetical protein